MHRLGLALSLAGLLSGCSLAPLNLLDPRRPGEEASAPAAPPVDLQRSTELAAPPPSPAPMLPERNIGDATFRAEQTKALDGDREAAFRVALMFRDGSHGVPRDERRMVRWLRHASELNHAAASYQLYLHFLARGLDRDALRYERKALQQGYVPPPRLDHRRS